MHNEQHQKIEDMLRTLLSSLSIQVDAITRDFDEKMSTMRFQISSPDSGLLIGERGARLQSLNYLLKKMAEKALGKGDESAKDDIPSFMVDVNNYQAKRIEELRTKASMLAERARYFRTSMPMEPMSSYERMIIHAEFTGVPDIRTESSGSGKDRHVVLYFDEKKASVA